MTREEKRKKNNGSEKKINSIIKSTSIKYLGDENILF